MVNRIAVDTALGIRGQCGRHVWLFGEAKMQFRSANCPRPTWLTRLGVFARIFAALTADAGTPERLMIDTTHLTAHRTAHSMGAQHRYQPPKMRFL